LRISWASPAASVPTAASFSVCLVSSARVFSSVMSWPTKTTASSSPPAIDGANEQRKSRSFPARVRRGTSIDSAGGEPAVAAATAAAIVSDMSAGTNFSTNDSPKTSSRACPVTCSVRRLKRRILPEWSRPTMQIGACSMART
jgi:hypothetical protein